MKSVLRLMPYLFVRSGELRYAEWFYVHRMEDSRSKDEDASESYRVWSFKAVMASYGKIEQEGRRTMTDNVENIILEHLKRIQTELSTIREHNREVITRLGSLEAAVARLGRDQAGNYAEIITDRNMIDNLRDRMERIERRLELI